MPTPDVRSADQVDPRALSSFLYQAYRPGKASFLDQHGEWWHRGQHNRWVIEQDGEVVAYCAVIPTVLRVAGERRPAVWWVDLVVDPAHRGRGLQHILDERVRSAAPLVVGFPNELAAAIHRRHGWGVRDDLEVRLLPLHPAGIVRHRAADNRPGPMMRSAALLAAPAAAVLRRRLMTRVSRFSGVLDRPGGGELAEIFSSAQLNGVATTDRDRDYIEWRYLGAPYRDELAVVGGGRGDRPSTIAVVRVMDGGGDTVSRILDLFGDLDDWEVVHDVLLTAARHSLRCGACQVTAMAANLGLLRHLRRAGFLAGSRARFCWRGSSSTDFATFGGPGLHVVLGDSDNDEP
jgi:GNAT superfamily N-acetyltransferase